MIADRHINSHSFYFYFFIALPCFTLSTKVGVADNKVGNYRTLLLNSGVGPESFAFDCNGEGPYTGVSDGRILKWQDSNHGWTEFAVPSETRSRDLCDGANEPALEPICGRPLGLQFNQKTCDLYIADAYFGLLTVGKNGGVATLLASSAEGVPFRFTNGVDVNQEDGHVYFTDSSTNFQRWAYMLAVLTGDNTGRLMRFNPQTKQVTVLMRDLKMANGVALSKDNNYILVAESTTSRVLRYWLQGPKARTSEVFSQLPGHPDNIKRNCRGEFWVGLNTGRVRLGKAMNLNSEELQRRLNNTIMKTFSNSDIVATRLSAEGKVLEVLRSGGGLNLESVSEVEEHKGSLWIGSVDKPYVYLSGV